MKKLGFIISKKENENRRAIVLSDLEKIKNKSMIYFEKGYFDVLGGDDKLIINKGFKVLDRQHLLNECDILVDPKIGDAEYLDEVSNKITFGWIHATQNIDITDKYIKNKLTGIAWEKMFEDNRHVFYKNNEIAGEAAILHAMITYGKIFAGLNVAIIGNGNSAKGANKILNQIGANVTIYSRNKESLLKKELFNYDIIVNCILWDVTRKDHIINRSDLKTMKKGALIIDVSCDAHGGIETSIPTTIDNPIYLVDGIYHYVVDHTPSLLFKNASECISNEVVKYIDLLITGESNPILDNSLIIDKGIIIDGEINKYQGR